MGLTPRELLFLACDGKHDDSKAPIVGGADLTDTVFSTSTILFDGQAVARHAFDRFDTAGLQTCLVDLMDNASDLSDRDGLENIDIGGRCTSKLIFIPEPTALLLALLALTAVPLRVRCGCVS